MYGPDRQPVSGSTLRTTASSFEYLFEAERLMSSEPKTINAGPTS